jgi:hypothetical protein
MERQPLQLSSLVTREEGFLTTPSEDGITMLGESEEVYHLDVVGRRIWTLLEQPCPILAVCTALQEEFSVDPETCQRDVLAFLEKIREKGLIKVVPETPSQPPV